MADARQQQERTDSGSSSHSLGTSALPTVLEDSDPPPDQQPSLGFESSDEGPAKRNRFSTRESISMPHGMSQVGNISYTAYRSFSMIADSEETMFWSTLIQGYSILPFFMLAFTMVTNTGMGLVFSVVADVPYTHGMRGWLRLLSNVGCIVILLRNLLVSFFELMLDSVAAFPLLNPGMLNQLRTNVAVQPDGLRYVINYIHMYFAVSIFITCGVGVEYGPLPDTLRHGRITFLLNFGLKYLLWILYILPKPFNKQEYELVKQGKSGGVAMSVEKRRAAIKAMHQARKARQTAVLYYSYSDIALFFLMVAAHYVSPHGLHGDDSLETANKELEQNVLTFNFLAMVLTNAAQMGILSHDALSLGASLLERAKWTDVITRARQVSLMMTVVLTITSAIAHGLLPAFFTFLVTFNCLAFSKLILWACVELQRTGIALQVSLKRLPVLVLPSVIGFYVSMRMPLHDLVLFGALAGSVYWAVWVQKRLHLIDLWVAWTFFLAVILSLHQAFYPRYATTIDDLFQVSSTPQEFRVSSPIGNTVLQLAPPGQPPVVLPAARGRGLLGLKGYPFCDHKLFGLNLMDYAALSFLSYFKNGTSHFDDFAKATLPPGWKPLHMAGDKSGGAVFIDMYNKAMNLSIISVRGTNPKNLYDVFQDMVLFNGAFSWDLTCQCVPVLRLIPQRYSTYILYVASLPFQFGLKQSSVYRDKHFFYHNEVEHYVRDALATRQVVMTGHSLGGGIAKIVSAKMGVPVVAISSPGIALSHRIFNVSMDNIDKFEINLINGEDIVPMFDRLQGLVMQMRCPMASPLDCHQLGVTICDLVHKCGSQFSPGAGISGRILECRNER